MNSLLRHLLCAIEFVVYGPAYAGLNHKIREPEPLDPERLWSSINPTTPNAGNWLAEIYPPGFMRPLLLAAKMKQDHLIGIEQHYNVSNDFYRLFLDKKYMFYSCADFIQHDDTLEQAQTNKANFILNLIDPKPGQRILDLGCGWGAMMKRVHEETGDRDNLYGYTLSQEQVNYNEQHNGFHVQFRNFITCDYPAAEFDTIYSIGAWEHVRRRDLPMLLEKLHRSLKPGGRLIKHFFASCNERLTNDIVIMQLFFPGTYTPSHQTQVREFERAGFRILRRTIHDYRPTLRAWFDNLVTNKDAAIELVGLKTYNKYLVFFAASHFYFNAGKAMLIRYVLEKE